MNIKSLNTGLRKAAKAKKDEFYTQLGDIEKELKHYKDQFRGKVVFCNCDDPRESNFVKYFSMNFEHLGLKKLIATHFQDADLFTREHPYKLEYTGDKNANRIPDPDEFTIEMIGTGDFRSEECIELQKEADIVVTNPPFSLFREYLAQLVEYEKKFLIIGSKNVITYKDVFPLIKENKMWLGYGFERGNAYFQTPYSNDSYASGVYNPETGLVKFRNVGWFTNLDTTKRHEDLVLYKKYTLAEFPNYDNYDAINVNKVADIPMDYDGFMGVPITFTDKYNPDQFEMFGIMNTGEENKGIRYEGTPHGRPVINGVEKYLRILIKNKKINN